MKSVNRFHLAIPVNDLGKCRQFYCEVLGCGEGRSSDHWVDLDFFGHQLVLHKKHGNVKDEIPISNPVDGHNVPIPHFGVVLDWKDWEILADVLNTRQIEFVIEPYIRFKGEAGEQATMFFTDPEGNALEFKAFKDMDQLFAKS